jgi:hypothetical protein
MHGDRKELQKSCNIDTRKLAGNYEIAWTFHKEKKRDRLACNRETAKTHTVFYALVDAARFAGGARSLEKRAVTGA